MKLRIGPLELSRTDLTHDGVLYMRRWVAEIPMLGGIRLHRIAGPDPDRHLHDHPFDFVSLVLWGWYDETYDDNEPCEIDAVFSRRRRWLALNRFRAEHLHQITQVAPGGCWTLVLSGRRRRPWGFNTAVGWILWSDYYLKEHKP